MFSNKNLEGTFSGPLPNIFDINPTFFVSAKYRKSDGYLYGIREHNPSDSSNFEPKPDTSYIEIEDKIFTRIIEFRDEWYIENNGDGDFVPMNPSESINLLGKMKFQLNESLILRLKSIYNNSESKYYSHSYKYNADGLPPAEVGAEKRSRYCDSGTQEIDCGPEPADMVPGSQHQSCQQGRCSNDNGDSQKSTVHGTHMSCIAGEEVVAVEVDQCQNQKGCHPAKTRYSSSNRFSEPGHQAQGV